MQIKANRHFNSAARITRSSHNIRWMHAVVALTMLIGLAPNDARAINTEIDVKIGTLGTGLEFAHAFTDSAGIRLGFNSWNYSKATTENGVDYDAKLKLRSFQFLGEWYPFGGVFRFDLGLVSNGNKFDLTAKPSAGGTYTFNGVPYSAAQVGSAAGHVNFKKLAPYLGIGWGTPAGSGFTLTADVGVLFQGKPRSTLSVVCGSSLNASQCQSLTDDVTAEQAKLDESLKNFKYYPVLSIGVGYKF